MLPFTHIYLGQVYRKSVVPFLMGFPVGASSKEPTCQRRKCQRCEFDPWVGKIPWRRARQPTPVSLLEEPGGLLSMGSHRVGHVWNDLASRHTLILNVSTTNWHLPRAFAVIEQEGHLLYSSAGIELYAAAAGDQSTTPRGTQGGEWDTLCSTETGGTGL